MIERGVLLAPDIVARSAASLVKDPAQRWMLGQPTRVRRSYVHEVMDRGNDTRAQTIWMLRQPVDVRRSYVKHVAEPGDAALRWMLGQPDAVRESYINEVLQGA